MIASCATDRHVLALLQPVTLEDLKKSPDRDLRAEHMRQKALEHNTLLKFGFMSGRPATVPDSESRLALTDPTGNVELTWDCEPPNAQSELKVSHRKNLKREKPDSVDDDGGDCMSG